MKKTLSVEEKGIVKKIVVKWVAQYRGKLSEREYLLLYEFATFVDGLMEADENK